MILEVQYGGKQIETYDFHMELIKSFVFVNQNPLMYSSLLSNGLPLGNTS